MQVVLSKDIHKGKHKERYMHLVKENKDKIKNMKLRALLLSPFSIFIVWPEYC